MMNNLFKKLNCTELETLEYLSFSYKKKKKKKRAEQKSNSSTFSTLFMYRMQVFVLLSC